MTKNLPVLYAEDDQNDAFLMQRAFRLAEISNPLYIVDNGQATTDYLAGEGTHADRIRHPLPYLVLLDLKMPLLSGLDVLKWIRSDSSLTTTPVLMVTSSNQDSDIRRAYLLGANGYLVKPGTPNELLNMVKGIKDFWLTLNQIPNRVRLQSENLR